MTSPPLDLNSPAALGLARAAVMLSVVSRCFQTRDACTVVVDFFPEA